MVYGDYDTETPPKKRIIQFENEKFFLGKGIVGIRKGDLIETPKGLERISETYPTGNYNTCFKTTLGNEYLDVEVIAYGRRIDSTEDSEKNVTKTSEKSDSLDDTL